MMADTDRDYWEQRLSGGPSLETVGWLSLGDAFNRGMYRVRAAMFKSRVRHALRRAGLNARDVRVLDVGAGSGFYIDLWQRLGVSDVTGADLTDAVVSSLAKRFSKVRFYRADIGSEDATVSGAPFDAVSCMDVLFHITDDEKYHRAFKNMAALLRRGGLLILTENCLHGKRIAGPHQVSRSLAETTRALADAGFEILERRPAFVLLNTPVDSDNALLRLQWEVLKRIAGKSRFAASGVCALLYPIERLLTGILREGPSTEMLICRKL